MHTLRHCITYPQINARIYPTIMAKIDPSLKREKFVRLAQSRTIKAIKSIRVIGKLGNRSHYEYGEKDVKAITNALTKEIEALKIRMFDQGDKLDVEFTL